MILTNTWQNNYAKERRIQYLRHHFESFGVEPAFPLPLFEEAVFNLNNCPALEPSFKVQESILFAGRVTAFTTEDWPQLIKEALNFFDAVESRVEATIDRSLLEQFLTLHQSSGKIEGSLMGIDLRPNPRESSLKVHLRLDLEQDVEELVMTAINLDGGYYSPELMQVLLRDTFLIGFDFFLNGDSAVEMYTTCAGRKASPFLGKKGAYLKSYLYKNFSHRVTSLLEKVAVVTVGFSQENPKPVIYFEFEKLQDIKSYLSFNSLGDKIYDFCLHNQVGDFVSIGVTEPDLEKSRLENFRLYYRKLV